VIESGRAKPICGRRQVAGGEWRVAGGQQHEKRPTARGQWPAKSEAEVMPAPEKRRTKPICSWC
jgi:hypothetical protein